MICLYEIVDEYDNNENMIMCFIIHTKCEFQKPESLNCALKAICQKW